MIAKEEVAQFNILKFPQVPISILFNCNDDTDKVVCTCIYRYIYIFTYSHTYIILIFLFRYTNVMELFNRFYSTVLEQKVLTCKNHIFFLQQRKVLFVILLLWYEAFFIHTIASISMCIFQKYYKLRRYFCVLVLTLFRCPTGMINFFDRVSCFCLCHDAVIFFPNNIRKMYCTVTHLQSRTYVSKIDGKIFVEPVQYGLVTVRNSLIPYDKS